MTIPQLEQHIDQQAKELADLRMRVQSQEENLAELREQIDVGRNPRNAVCAPMPDAPRGGGYR
jgi:hypothetical protein